MEDSAAKSQKRPLSSSAASRNSESSEREFKVPRRGSQVTPTVEAKVNHDEEALSFAKAPMDKGNHRLVLAIIQLQYLGNDSVFAPFGWSNPENADVQLKRDATLLAALKKSFEANSLDPLRDWARKVPQTPTGAILTNQFGDGDPVNKVNEAAWNADYQGDASRLFVDALHDINTEKDSHQRNYSNFIVILQSSGMGKSRLVDEAAKSIFTLPFNVRTAEDKTAFPRPDDSVRDFLTDSIGSVTSLALEIRYLRFFSLLFKMVKEELSKLSACKTPEEFALSWYKKCADPLWRKGFYERLCKDARNGQDEQALCNDKHGQEIAHKESRQSVQHSVEALLNDIHEKSTPSNKQVEVDQPVKPVQLLLYFDESQSLVDSLKTTKDDETLVRSGYQVLCKAFNTIVRYDVLVVHLSTNSKLNTYSPRPGDFWSSRGNQPGVVKPDRLQAPYVELPFDALAVVRENDLTLETVATTKHLVQFGRPLFATRFNAAGADDSIKSGIIQFAADKLFGGSMSSSDANVQKRGKLAAYSIRLMLEFEPRRESAEVQEALVAGHMRVAYSVPNHRQYLRSGTPSEPLLAEAAACIMNDGKSTVLNTLNGFFDEGVSKGERGELVARLLLTLAHDKACGIVSGPAASPHYSKPISVVDFLVALIGPAYIERVLDATPANATGPPLREAFRDGRLNFTHFVKAGDSGVISDIAAWKALSRCMAFVCANSQRMIDLYIPISLWNEKLSRRTVSAIFIQVKNRVSEAVAKIDAVDLNFFGPDDETVDTQKKERPYISLVMNLGVQPKRLAKTSSATVIQQSPSKVSMDSVPPRKQPSRKRKATTVKGVHPKYSINIVGCSSNVYNVIGALEKDTYAGNLGARDILQEHPRTEKYHDAVLRLKPYWLSNDNTFHWAKEGDQEEEDNVGVLDDVSVEQGDSEDDDTEDQGDVFL